VDQGLSDAVLAAHDLDMGVFIISPADKGGELYDPPQTLVDLTAPVSPMVFNDLFCLKDPRIHTLSLGAARPADFDEHMKVLPYLEKGDWSLFDQVKTGLDQELKGEIGEGLLDSIRALPDYDLIPHGVNVRVILRLWSLAKAFDMIEFGKMRYNLIGNGGHWFPGQLPTTKNLDEVKAFLKSYPEGEALGESLGEAMVLLKGEEQKRLSESD